MQPVRRLLTQLGVFTSRPWAFALVAAYGVAWWHLQPESLDWHGFVALGTLLMTLLIQRAQHRDTQAIHAKLDELLHAQQGARDAFARIDEREPVEIERLRERERGSG
jgi:low affinity Fe/Cu permease